MADYTVRYDAPVPGEIERKFVDHGDGTHALEVAIGGDVSVAPSATPSVTVVRVVISGAVNGNNTLVPAVSGQKIKVLGMVLVVSGDVDVRFESGAGGTALTGVMSLAADGNGFVLPMAQPGYHWLETLAGQLLNMELSAGVQVSGWLAYYTEA